MNPLLKPILWQATTFTIAHSITLGLSMIGAISLPTAFIEPIIALSIVFVALDNIFTYGNVKFWRILVVFFFGLIHGMGFASALSALGLPSNHFFISLISFNVGVEIGQLVIILTLYSLIGKWFSNKKWYNKIIVYPLSALIAIIATYWTFERILN
jgi:HupE / UreJ protein